MHPAQDFYAHSNWVELERTDIIDDGNGKWTVLQSFNLVRVYIIQGEDRNIPQGYTLTKNGKIVNVTNLEGNHPGLISDTFGVTDDCPDSVSISHDELNKDEPHLENEDLFNKAKDLAIKQTKHE